MLLDIQRSLERDLLDRVERSLEDGHSTGMPGAEDLQRFLGDPGWQDCAGLSIGELLSGDGITIVGDYHPLPESKSLILSLLEHVAGSGRVPLLAIDSMVSRHSSVTINCLQSSARFLPEPVFAREAWEAVFEALDRLGVPVVGTGVDKDGETTGSGLDYRTVLQQKLERLRPLAEWSRGPVLAVTGELNALPGALPRMLAAEGIGHAVPSIILAASTLYWKRLEAGYPSDGSEGRIWNGPGNTLAFTAIHPVRKPNSFLSWIEDEREAVLPVEGGLDASSWPWSSRTDTLQTAWSSLCAVLLEKGAELVGSPPEVYLPGDLSRLTRLLPTIPCTERDELLGQMKVNASYCSPRGDWVYLADSRWSSVGEEFSHSLHLRLAPGSSNCKTTVEMVLRHAVRECLAFFGSKVLAPDRNAPAEESLSDGASAIVAFARGRCGLETLEAMFELNEAAGDRETLTASVHQAGYFMGERMWECLDDGSLEIADIRCLYSTPLTGIDQVSEMLVRMGRHL